MLDLGSLVIDIQLKAQSALVGIEQMKNGLNAVKTSAETMQKALNGSASALNANATSFNGLSKASLAALNINGKTIKSDEDLIKLKEELTQKQKKLNDELKAYQNILERAKTNAKINEIKYESSGSDVVNKLAGTTNTSNNDKIIANAEKNIALKQKELKLVDDVNSKIEQNLGLIDKQNEKVDENTKKMQNNTKSIQDNGAAYRTLSIYATMAFAVIVAAMKQGIDATVKYTNAMQGLKSVSLGTGNSFGAAQKFIESYTSDGLIPAAEAATALKNLLSRGFTQTQAEEVLYRLKDAAAFGRQGSLELGQAVASASEGLKNENSILVDNAGVTKNVAKMWDEYAKSIGKTRNDLTQAEKVQAEYNGIMQETRNQKGDAIKLANNLSGSQSKLNASTTKLAQNFGNSLAPSLTVLINLLIPIVEGISNFIKENQTLVSVLTYTAAAFFGIIVVVTSVSAVITTLNGALAIMKLTLGTLMLNPVTIALVALAATIGLVATNLAKANQKAAESKQRLEEEAAILEEVNRLKREGIALDKKDTYQDKATKSRYYLQQYDEINQKMQDLSFWVYSFDKKEIRLMDEGEKIKLQQAKEELKQLSIDLDNIIKDAGDEGINLTSKQAIENTRKLTKEEEKQLEITNNLNTEINKTRMKEIANTQSSIQTVKNLIETYKKAKKGTSDWIEAEEKLAELYPEFSTLSGIKITAIENEIEAKEKQTKADWTAFKQEAKITAERLKAMTTEEEVTKNLISIKALEAQIRYGDTSAYQAIQEALKQQQNIKDAKEAIKYYEEIANMNINEVPGTKPVRKEADDKTSAEKTAYEKAIELYEHRKNLGQLTLKDEVNVLNEIKKLHAKKTEEIMDIDERIYSAKTALSDSILAGYEKDYNAQVKTSERWVKQQKGFNKLTEQQEVDAYNRMIAYKKDYIKKILADESITTDKKIEIKERENDAIEDLEMDIFNLQTENMKKIVKTKEDYLDDYDSQLDRFINQQKLRNNITDDEGIANYKTQIKEHKKYLAEIETDTKLSEEEKIKIRKEELQKIEDIEDKIYTVKKEYIDKALDDYMQSLEDEIEANEEAELKKLQDAKDAVKEKYETIDEEKESADRATKLAELRKREELYQNAATKDGLEELKKIKDDIKDLEDEEEKQRLENQKEAELDALDKQIEDTETKYDTMRKNLKTLRTDMENEAFKLAENINVNLINVQQSIADKSIAIFNNTNTELDKLLKNIQDKAESLNSIKSNLSAGTLASIDNITAQTQKTIPTVSSIGKLTGTAIQEGFNMIKEMQKSSSSSTFTYNDYGQKNFNNIKEVDDFGEDVFLAHAKARTTK